MPTSYLAGFLYLLLPLGLFAQQPENRGDSIIFMDAPIDELILKAPVRTIKETIEVLPVEYYGTRAVRFNAEKYTSTLWDLARDTSIVTVPYKTYKFLIPKIEPYEDFRGVPPGGKVLFKAYSNKKFGLLDKDFNLVYPVTASRIKYLEESLMPFYFEILNEAGKVQYLDSNLVQITTRWSEPPRFWPGGANYFRVENQQGVVLYRYSGTPLNKKPYSSHNYAAKNLAEYEYPENRGGVYAIVSKKKRFGLLAPNGSLRTKMRYDSIVARSTFYTTYALLFRRGKAKLFDTKAGTYSEVDYDFGALSPQLERFREEDDKELYVSMLWSKSVFGILRRQGEFFILESNGTLSPLTELPEDTPKAFRDYIGWQ